MNKKTSARKRFDKLGASALTEEELFLFLGTPAIVRKLEDVPNFWRLDHTLTSLRQQGIPPREARAFLAVRELSRRMARSNVGLALAHDIPDPLAAARFLSRYYVDEQERFGSLYLDDKGKVVHAEVLLTGSPYEKPASIATIFRRAVEVGAPRLIACHTQPSGEPTSPPDEHVFAQFLRQTFSLLEIELTDYLIIGASERHLSLGWKLGWDRTEG
jgi:DNA repair protein RadC